MGLKKKVAGQWVSDSGVDVKIDNNSVMSGDVASIATTGSYDGDGTSPNYNPIATKDYVDQAVEDLPEPMVWTGVISITADSTDTAKCAISVSAPASATNIKKGFTYKVSFIAASPAYTGTIKIGDTFIAAKDAPKVDKTWIEDADWNVVPSGDESGGNYSITVLWDYTTDNSGIIPYEPFTGTLHNSINNYDAIQLEVVSSSGDLDDSGWDSTMLSSIIPVYVLNNSFKNNYFNFNSFGERSSRWYIKDTTIQKTTTNISGTNGLVRVYGIKF